MKKLILLLTTFCASCALQAQTTIVNKQLKDFPNVYDLSTPLSAGVTIEYLIINGTDKWRESSVSMNNASKVVEGIKDKGFKKRLLDGIVKEVIVYQDSVACMILQISPDDYSLRLLCFENDKWLNRGNDRKRTIEESRNLFNRIAPEWLSQLRRANEIKIVSTDTLAFVNYVKQRGTAPTDFLLEALENYPLVIYGEYHRRKVSWDLLSSLLSDPRFPETVGTVFVEMPAYQQAEFDRFFSSKELNTEILLEILRSFQIYGWWDRGQYDFYINLWKLNQTLPEDKRIRVVPTDEQAPWKLLQTKEDFKQWRKNSTDRNIHMANVVENTIKTKPDERNCLFVVGYGHAYKSHVPGGYTSNREPLLSAGAELVQRLSDKDVFVVFQHVPMGNNVRDLGLIRQGLFDAVFEKNGNKPIAFALTNSPFGVEPYDADSYDCLDYRSGNFADNFDGYIFLNPLEEEEEQYVLYEIWNDQFVKEFIRRATFLDWNGNKWLGNKGKLTKEKIIKVFKEDEGKKRWGHLFE
jgi:hypothetical protein